MQKNNSILAITPVKHIQGLTYSLKNIGKLTVFENPSKEQLKKIIHKYDAVFTNPNKSKIYINKEIMDLGTRLKVICTASTGTNHIDTSYAKKINLKIISLTKDINIIKKISSTAELALALTLASLRNVVKSNKSVLNGEWDYTKYIGQQINFLTIGIIGYGRLGKIYANYCKAFGCKVIFYDPYKKSTSNKIKKEKNLTNLICKSDIISLHVHVRKDTTHMINKRTLSHAKKNIIIINTSRGEIVDELEIIAFLKKNKNAKYATDVLEKEIFGIRNNKLIKYAKKNTGQVIITPHIGGMTIEAQNIAYSHSVKKLGLFFSNLKTSK